MFKSLVRKVKAWEAEMHASFNTGIDTPEDFERVQKYMFWHDHGILRTFWHNVEEIGPGVFRSNQPDFKRLKAFKEAGGKTVLTLRGPAPLPYSAIEEAQCEQLGLDFRFLHLGAKVAPSRKNLLALIDALENLERPLLVHCKSGADRTGLASAVYKLHFDGASVAEAQRQLSFRYMHLRKSGAGVQGHVLDWYERRLNEKGPIPFRDWVTNEYDPAAVQASFDSKRKKR